MKQDSLFEGAIVLARSCRDEEHGKRRSRCKIIVLGSAFATMQDQCGRKFVTRKSDIRPAKITRNSLKELGFIEKETTCPRRVKKACLEYMYPDGNELPWAPRIILKDECDQWGPTRMFGGLGVHQVSYIHEVQRIINQ